MTLPSFPLGIDLLPQTPRNEMVTLGGWWRTRWLIWGGLRNLQRRKELQQRQRFACAKWSRKIFAPSPEVSPSLTNTAWGSSHQRPISIKRNNDARECVVDLNSLLPICIHHCTGGLKLALKQLWFQLICCRSGESWFTSLRLLPQGMMSLEEAAE